jgi:hypothetical protein
VASSGAADEWDLVVPADGNELLAELDRHGVKPGQRVHLRAVPDPGRAEVADVDASGWPGDLAHALQQSAATKRPPFAAARGMLAGLVPAPTWIDFEEVSRVAATEAEASGTLPE